MSVIAALCAAALFAAGGAQAQQPASGLTIQVGGDLLKHGGVVVVYSIPTPAGEWAATGSDDTVRPVRIEDRYALVQVRYPADGDSNYRFRPVPEAAQADRFATQPLSIIGTDFEGRGPKMTGGFTGAHSSGGRIIRVLPEAERSLDEATRTNARWGVTERNDAPPPADVGGARALMHLVEHGRPTEEPLQCTGDGRAQVCTIPRQRWTALEARWWRSIAESRLERLRDRALRRCYDEAPSSGGTCEPDPRSSEPAYRHRSP